METKTRGIDVIMVVMLIVILLIVVSEVTTIEDQLQDVQIQLEYIGDLQRALMFHVNEPPPSLDGPSVYGIYIDKDPVIKLEEQ